MFGFRWLHSKKYKSKKISRYGWIPDHPDTRDFNYNLLRKVSAPGAAPEVLPSAVDLRSKCPPVENQKDEGSCFHQDTKIPLLDGKVFTIKELAEGIAGSEFWVYSCREDGTIVPGKAIARLTGRDRVLVKILLDNNESILCTPDHLFMKRDGSYIEARSLATDDSLMPLYRSRSTQGLQGHIECELYKDNRDNKYHYTHMLRAPHDHSRDYTIYNTDNTHDEIFSGDVGQYNHKVISVSTIEGTYDVYDLTVERYHNFALKSGVFVHNCTTFSLAGAYGFLQIQGNKPWVPVSHNFLYYNERVMEGTINSDSGAQIRDGIKSLASTGICKESKWPYTQSNMYTKPNSCCYAQASGHKILSYYRITSLDDMKHCLAQGYPFVFGFTVYSSFESDAVAKTGIMPMPSPTDSVIGGHAVTCVGYDDSKKWMIVRNSWGTEWGDQGYFYMPYEYITTTNLADDMWTIRTEQVF